MKYIYICDWVFMSEN